MGTSVDMSDREGAGKSPHHSSSASNAEVSHIKAPSRAIDGDPEGTQRWTPPRTAARLNWNSLTNEAFTRNTWQIKTHGQQDLKAREHPSSSSDPWRTLPPPLSSCFFASERNKNLAMHKKKTLTLSAALEVKDRSGVRDRIREETGWEGGSSSQKATTNCYISVSL